MKSAIAPIAPSLGPDARKAETSGRADSYASGAHEWNGTSELLNASAARISSDARECGRRHRRLRQRGRELAVRT